jgi:hypothetical protein
MRAAAHAFFAHICRAVAAVLLLTAASEACALPLSGAYLWKQGNTCFAVNINISPAECLVSE